MKPQGLVCLWCFRRVNKKVEILLCVCCLGFQGVEDADSVSWKPRLLGLREGGFRVDSRVPERRDTGRVQDGTPAHPQTSAGPLVHLASVPLSSVMRRMLTRESQSQKALEPDGGELESPPKPTSVIAARTELPQIPTNP